MLTHKFECHKDSNDGLGLRVFKYAKGLTYLTDIKSEPKVEEIQIERCRRTRPRDRQRVHRVLEHERRAHVETL